MMCLVTGSARQQDLERWRTYAAVSPRCKQTLSQRTWYNLCQRVLFMETARPLARPEATEFPSRSMSRRRAWDNDKDTGTTISDVSSTSSNVDEEAKSRAAIEDAHNDDASSNRLVETALSVCWQVDLYGVYGSEAKPPRTVISN